MTVCKALHGKRATDESLRSPGFHIPSVCRLCRIAEKTNENLLLRWSFSRRLWLHMQRNFNVRLDFDGNFTRFISPRFGHGFNPLVSNLWRACCVGIWTIGRIRNQAIFLKGLNLSIHQVIFLWCHLLREANFPDTDSIINFVDIKPVYFET